SRYSQLRDGIPKGIWFLPRRVERAAFSSRQPVPLCHWGVPVVHLAWSVCLEVRNVPGTSPQRSLFGAAQRRAQWLAALARILRLAKCVTSSRVHCSDVLCGALHGTPPRYLPVAFMVSSPSPIRNRPLPSQDLY